MFIENFDAFKNAGFSSDQKKKLLAEQEFYTLYMTFI